VVIKEKDIALADEDMKAIIAGVLSLAENNHEIFS
jgi:hypothetical protein